MSVSYSTVTVSKMELTPMRVKFKPAGAGSFVDLGGTLSNIVIEIKYEKAEIKADQLGTTVLDRRVKGFVCTVTTELTEILNKKDVVQAVFPHATYSGTSPADALDFNSMVGDADLTYAGDLVLHPLSRADVDLDYDYNFYKAISSAESSVTYGPDNQARLKIVWTILPDLSTSPPQFFRYGDPAV